MNTRLRAGKVVGMIARTGPARNGHQSQGPRSPTQGRAQDHAADRAERVTPRLRSRPRQAQPARYTSVILCDQRDEPVDRACLVGRREPGDQVPPAGEPGRGDRSDHEQLAGIIGQVPEPAEFGHYHAVDPSRGRPTSEAVVCAVPRCSRSHLPPVRPPQCSGRRRGKSRRARGSRRGRLETRARSGPRGKGPRPQRRGASSDSRCRLRAGARPLPCRQRCRKEGINRSR